MPRQRDIFLAPFPFSDEATEKQRPILIISNSVFNAAGSDVIAMAITSNLNAATTGIDIGLDSVEDGALPAPSRILPLKVYSISQDRLGRYYCRLASPPFRLAIDKLVEALATL